MTDEADNLKKGPEEAKASKSGERANNNAFVMENNEARAGGKGTGEEENLTHNRQYWAKKG